MFCRESKGDNTLATESIQKLILNNHAWSPVHGRPYRDLGDSDTNIPSSHRSRAKQSSARNWEWEEESVSQAVTVICQLHSRGGLTSRRIWAADRIGSWGKS